MNDQLQQAVAALIDKSLKAFESGADFMAAQLPDVVQQLLMWHMALSAAKAVGAVVFAAVLIAADIYAFKKFHSYRKETHDTAAIPIGWGLAGCIVRVPAWVAAVSLWNLTWLQIWVAPKIFLIEYAAKMVTK